MLRPLAVLPLLWAGAAAAAEAQLPAISLQPVTNGWRVSYTLDQPVRALRFVRPDAKGHRAQQWQPGDPAFELVLDGGSEVIRRRDGGEFRAAAFEMAPHYTLLDKDYAPFSPFGDGGLLIHSGRLFACAPDCDTLPENPRWTLRVQPPAGSYLLHDGRRHDAALQYSDGDSGTNLYVGAAEPVETSEFIAIVDAEFPAPIREQLNTLFPRLMALYAQELGALERKPMLFASFDESHPGGGFGQQGGTLPGQVFMHFYGAQKLDDPIRSGARLSQFFAHEAAHLYQRYEQAEPGTPAWIHEGGAEALALVALRRLGELSNAAERGALSDAKARCDESLRRGTLADAEARGDFAASYACGLLLQMQLDAAVRGASGERCDLFCLWRDFLDQAERSDAWNLDGFLASAERHAGAAAATTLRAALVAPHPAGSQQPPDQPAAGAERKTVKP